jgi:predicted metal-binding membrane protein
MGLEYGAYCVGCCRVLMALLLVGGVMNLFRVAAITGFVLIEKIAPGSNIIRRMAAVLLINCGAYTLV